MLCVCLRQQTEQTGNFSEQVNKGLCRCIPADGCRSPLLCSGGCTVKQGGLTTGQDTHKNSVTALKLPGCGIDLLQE